MKEQELLIWYRAFNKLLTKYNGNFKLVVESFWICIYYEDFSVITSKEFEIKHEIPTEDKIIEYLLYNMKMDVIKYNNAINKLEL